MPALTCWEGAGAGLNTAATSVKITDIPHFLKYLAPVNNPVRLKLQEMRNKSSLYDLLKCYSMYVGC